MLSLDEGFGRTPFEAVACGCKRIILSDIEIFHETFEGNATFLPLNNESKATLILSKNKIKEVMPGFTLPFYIIEQRITNLI